MIIIPVQEFNHQARNHSKLSGKVYHNKLLNPGVIFSAKQKEAAIQYCLSWMKNNQSFLCILVEDTHHLQVWYEQLSRKASSKTPKNLLSNPSSSPVLESQYLPLDREFLVRCHQVLAEFIGPIAQIIMMKVLARDNQFNREEFITQLIQEIKQKKPIQEQDTEERLKELLYR